MIYFINAHYLRDIATKDDMMMSEKIATKDDDQFYGYHRWSNDNVSFSKCSYMPN